MLRYIRKDRYQTSRGMAVWTCPEALIDRLTDYCKAVHPNDLKTPKSECPGFAVAKLVDKYDVKYCKITSEVFDGTQVLVLDVDEVPKEVSNIGLWLPTVLPEKVYALWYTTPRYRDSAKRIRIVVPMTRMISNSEKRLMKKRLSIPGVDPASFEPAKFSLLPCWCEDTAEFSWGTVGSRWLDPDSDLPHVEEEQRVPQQCHKYTNDRILMKKLNALIQEVNDAPNGHSQEVIKPGLSKIFRQFHVNMDMLEDMAVEIDRYDRRSDFLGIAKWLSRQSV